MFGRSIDWLIHLFSFVLIWSEKKNRWETSRQNSHCTRVPICVCSHKYAIWPKYLAIWGRLARDRISLYLYITRVIFFSLWHFYPVYKWPSWCSKAGDCLLIPCRCPKALASRIMSHYFIINQLIAANPAGRLIQLQRDQIECHRQLQMIKFLTRYHSLHRYHCEVYIQKDVSLIG